MKSSPLPSIRRAWPVWVSAWGLLLCSFPAAGAASGRIFLVTSSPALESQTNSFAAFLQGLGYTVTVMQDPGVSPYERLDVIGSTNQVLRDLLIADLTNNYDLIIVHRNYGSGTLASSPEEIAIWNNLQVPILLCNAPIARNNRWRWVNTVQSGSVSSPRTVTFIEPNHPIVVGLNPDLFAVDNVPYGGVFNLDGSLPEGGPHRQALARASVVYSPLCLAVWEEAGDGQPRPFYYGSDQTYIRRRVFFEMQEYRNPGVPAWEGISWNGRRLWANAVAYAMTGTVPPQPPAIGDLSPPDGSIYNAAATSFSFQAASLQPIAPEAIRVVINGHDVSAQLNIGGTPTVRAVSYQPLEPNQVYNISIVVSNQTGVGSTEVQFATFDGTVVQTLIPAPDNTFTTSVLTNTYRLFLGAQSASAQIVSLTQINGADQPPVPRLKGVFTPPGNMAGPKLLPLTDALGQPRALRLPNDSITFTLGPAVGLTVQALYLVPMETPPDVVPPALAQASPYPNEANVPVSTTLLLQLVDGDTAVVLDSVRLLLDGSDVTTAPGTLVTHTASGVEVQRTPQTFLAPSQTHRVSVIYADGGGGRYTNEYGFRTVEMPALPPELALPVEAGVERGFNLRLHMAPNNPDFVFTNTAARAELQLAGLLVGPSGPVTNEITGTTDPAVFTETNVLNYSHDGTTQGQFTNDVLFPFGGTVSASKMAIEATAYLMLPAGIVTLGVASDDGFALTAGYETNLVLGRYDGTRGAQVPSEFQVLVYREGLYPVRLLYYDGGGAASLEFYSVQESARLLVNGIDPGEGSGPLPAYRLVRPKLDIVRQGGQVILSWYVGFTPIEYELHQTDNVVSGPWSLVSETPTREGQRYTVTRPVVPGGPKFFRLHASP